MTFPYTAGDVPAPLTEASSALNFLSGSNVSVAVEGVVRGISPPTYRLEVEGSIGRQLYSGCARHRNRGHSV